MEPERWNQVKQIVNMCLEMDPPMRAQHIADACGCDPELRAEVESLLANYSEAGDFLESPVDPSDEEVLTGRTLGAYQMREPIGHGGMGTVYRAVRTTDFEKEVAIKLVKRGMDTDFLLQRFRHERQILAGLDHPNIARLLDGGAASDGRPYLVMELIKGTAITEYAEEHKLEPAQRLELFRTVCAAVQYAHQNLVVHRDLKPSNVLVTEAGVPKLLDFGIAKLLEPEASTTQTVARLMTPECASPEQVRGESITTASDVYALGVLLYRLLTGEGPYQFTTRTPAEIQRLICETEPKKPSTVRPVARDLDNIVLKAMHKDPARRYVSAEQLSEDVRRYMNGLPVAARQDTFAYRASKFVLRHKAATVGTLAVALSLTGGLGAALWEAHIAKLQRARAERRFEDVRRLANSLVFEIHDAVQSLPGSTPVRKLIVDRALTHLDSLAKEAGGERDLQAELASAYERVATVQGSPGTPNLGDIDGALSSFNKALAIRQALADAAPGDLAAQGRHSVTLQNIAFVRFGAGRITEASEIARKALAIDLGITKDSRSGLTDWRRLATDYDMIGNILAGTSLTGSFADPQGALENHVTALRITGEMAKKDLANGQIKDRAAIIQMQIGMDLVMLGRRSEARSFHRQALQWWEARAVDEKDRKVQENLAALHALIGDSLVMDGDGKLALQEYQLSFEKFQALSSTDSRDAQNRLDLATDYLRLGAALLLTHQPVESLASLDKGIEMIRQLLAGAPRHGALRGHLALMLVWRGNAFNMRGDLDEALRNYQEARDIYKSLSNTEPRDVDSRLNLAATFSKMAGVMLKRSEIENAQRAYRVALDLSESFANSAAGSMASRYTAADAYAGLGRVAAARGDCKDAQSWYHRSLSMWDRVYHPGVISPNDFDTEGPIRVKAELARCVAVLARSPKSVAH